MENPLNVALVGYGFVGKFFHAPLIQATPGLTLHTVVSRDAAKVQADWPELTVVSDARTAFADPAVDLVVIASPNDTHATLALAALERGKHVVVDKPFTLTLQEARDVVAAASRAERVVSVFQNRRWDADFLTVGRVIEEGTLGRIAEFHSHFDRFRPRVQDRWRERDPLVVARARLIADGVPAGEVDAVEAEVLAELDEVERAALAAPFPEPGAPAAEFA